MGILAFIIILGALVLVHEYGHFLAARRTGVGVEEFGLGFPPRIYGWRRGSVLYSINAIPFGGFVRLVGENDDPGSANAFTRAAPWKQSLILAAGVLMNYLLAVVIMGVVFGVGLRINPDSFRPDPHAVLSGESTELLVSPDGPAATRGLRTGDQLVAVNGLKFVSTEQLIAYVKERDYPSLRVEVRRQGESLSREISAMGEGESRKYGLGVSHLATIRYPWYLAPWYGFMSVNEIAGQSVVGFWTLVKGFAQGHVSQDVTGPIGIAVITNEVSRTGVISLMQFAALLSVSLAILNILPLPALDGGRLALRIVGWMTRRPVSQKIEGVIHTVGFYALIAFLIYISVRDIDRFQVFQRLTSWFQ